MKIKTLAIIGAALLCMSSCNSSKTVLPYFTDIVEVQESVLPGMEYLATIQPSDELFISVQSEQPLATAAYQLPLINPALENSLMTPTQVRAQSYTVDSQGDILFPVLGKLHVAGLTCEQLRDELTAKISKDVEDPLVSVSLVNFNVIVAGEVKNPQKVKVDGTRITILDALAAAGDLTEYGERSTVLVIREVDGQRQYAHIDLNSSEMLTSPYYYLRPNDYVYVAPNKVRQANSKYNQNNAFKLSVISTIVSAASVIASLVIALTVK